MKRNKLGQIKKGNKPYNYKKNITKNGKICACCKIEKRLDEFGNNKNRVDGYHSYCKECCKKKRNEFKEYYLEYIKGYYKKNRKNLLLKNRERYLKNRDRYLNISKGYYEKNKERLLKISKKWAEDNREKSNNIKKEWKKRNPKIGF